MVTFNKCKDINSFNTLVDINKVQVKIGKSGGRYFIVNRKSFSMNQIVHKLEQIARAPSQAKELNLARQNVAYLNVLGNLKLEASSPTIQRLTAMRRFFGKLRYGSSFNKEKHLKDYSKIAVHELLQTIQKNAKRA